MARYTQEQQEIALLEIKNIAVAISTEMLFLIDEGTKLTDAYSMDAADDYQHALREFFDTLAIAIEALDHPINKLVQHD